MICDTKTKEYLGRRNPKCPNCGGDLLWCDIHYMYHHSENYSYECNHELDMGRVRD